MKVDKAALGVLVAGPPLATYLVAPGCALEQLPLERFPLGVPEVRLPPTRKYLRLPRGWCA